MMKRTTKAKRTTAPRPTTTVTVDMAHVPPHLLGAVGTDELVAVEVRRVESDHGPVKKYKLKQDNRRGLCVLECVVETKGKE